MRQALLSPHVRAVLQQFSSEELNAIRQYFGSRQRLAVPPEFADAVPERQLTTPQMTTLERVIEERIINSRNGRERLARLRLWCVFIFLRYGGLRLAEVLQLDDVRDVRLSACQLHVRGTHERTLSLPPHICRALQERLNEPQLQNLRGQLCHLDAGFLRRSLYSCAEDANLPREFASARVLRNSRAVELCREGLPLPVVHNFLGLTDAEKTAFLHYSPEDTLRITQAHLQRSMAMKTSARNLFPGRITALHQQDFMVEVKLETASGLRITALITEASRKRLDLAVGGIVIATVKAPFVHANLQRDDAPDTDNHFAGVVQSVRRTEFMQEVMVALKDGTQVCALLNSADMDAAITEGDAVVASFKAVSVVIGKD